MATHTHRAAVLQAPGQIGLEERATPLLEPWQVRVRVDLAGVCGTDLALVVGSLPSPLPLVPGHEFVGTVIEVSSRADERWLGQRVCADINNTCLSRREVAVCETCRMQHPHHCQRRTVTGIIEAPGAFAEQVVVPAENLFLVPDSVSDLQAVFTEPLAAAIQTFEQVPIQRGTVVCVLGTGRLGALIAAVAQRRGASVIAVGRREEPLAHAMQIDIGEAVIDQSGDVQDMIDGLTDGLGADVVVEATGNPEGLIRAIDLVRPRGSIVMKSTCGLPAEGLDQTRLVVDEISLVGSRCGPFDKALQMLAKGTLPVDLLVSETHPLRDIRQAIERAREAFKVLVTPG